MCTGRQGVWFVEQGLDQWRWELCLDSQKPRTSTITGSHPLFLSVCGIYGTTGLRSTGQGMRRKVGNHGMNSLASRLGIEFRALGS